MDPQMRFGSGSPLLGGSSPINEALKRRGVDVSILAQQGPNSAGAISSGQPMPSSPSGSAMPSGMPQGVPQANLPQPSPIPSMPLPQGSSDAQLILKALSARLASDSKINEANSIPPEPTPVTTPSPITT